MKVIKFKWGIGDKVRIPELDRTGTVLALYVAETGTQYSVRYFDNASPVTHYFYERELVTA